jgi:hypothetical protein
MKVRLPRVDLPALMDWIDQSPWRWLAVLVAAGPWLRVEIAPVTVYPLQWALTLVLGLALLGANPRARLAADPPLLPWAALAGWIALLALLRGQWQALGWTLAGGGGLWLWGWAARELGRQTFAPRNFSLGALLYLAATLLAGLAAWGLEAYWPAGCRAFNCNPEAAPPYPFHGGWASNTQFAILLILIAPLLAGPLATGRRALGGPRWAVAALAAFSGLALLAGARWWTLLVAGAGLYLFARVLAWDAHPKDRLLTRGIGFGFAFAAVTLYGLFPGYLGILLGGARVARSASVEIAQSGIVLSSDRILPVPVRLTNQGWWKLTASEDDPLRVRALLLITPRTGQTLSYPGGEALVTRTLDPGQRMDLSVPVRLPPWINTGYLMWQVDDAAGRAVDTGRGPNRGFRFANAGFYALDGADNNLTALSGRARALGTRALPPPEDRVRIPGGDSIVSNAVATMFFSPLWGHSLADPAGKVPLHPDLAVAPQLLHAYGLIGLALAAWLALRILRQSWQLGTAQAGGLTWRLVCVSTVLLMGLAATSGDPARYHALWGMLLVAGYVEGVFSGRYPALARIMVPVPDVRRWREWRLPRPGSPWPGVTFRTLGRAPALGATSAPAPWPALRMPPLPRLPNFSRLRFWAPRPVWAPPPFWRRIQMPRPRWPGWRRPRIPRIRLPQARLPSWAALPGPRAVGRIIRTYRGLSVAMMRGLRGRLLGPRWEPPTVEWSGGPQGGRAGFRLPWPSEGFPAWARARLRGIQLRWPWQPRPWQPPVVEWPAGPPRDSRWPKLRFPRLRRIGWRQR